MTTSAMNERQKRTAEIVFLGLLMAMLLTGLCFVVVSPLDVNDYENRTAEKPGSFTWENISSGVSKRPPEGCGTDNRRENSI